jgi:phosphoglycerate dehydrogenase-like enzyme
MLCDGAKENVAKRIAGSPDAAPFEVIIPEDGSEASQLAVARDAEVMLCYLAQLPGSVIRAAPSLKLIQKYGVNCRNIDVAAASERKVKVATLPLMRAVSVAEHALAMMLACARKIVPAHKAVSEAVYQQMGLTPVRTENRVYRANWPQIQGLTELYQATVGIVGMGDIGLEIARRCRPFGMNIVYHQRTPHPADFEHAVGIRYRSLDELLSASDYVVLVVPHTPETEGLIGAKEFARMKPTATLVNVGRGALIDEDALAAALKQKPQMMAALDVYRMEPLPVTSALRTLPNVVLLPHIGGGSYRSREIDIPAVLRNMAKFFADEKIEGIINA